MALRSNRDRFVPPKLSVSRGRLFCYIPRTDRKRRWFGPETEPESHAAYARYCKILRLEWEREVAQLKSPVVAMPRPDQCAGQLTIVEAALLYLPWAKEYYGSKGITEFGAMRQAVKRLVDLHGERLLDQFGPNRLRELQQAMATEGRARNFINSTVNRVRRFVRWCVSRELADGGLYHALSAVQALSPGKTSARETDAVTAVNWSVVEATMPFLPPPLRVAVYLQFCCGMRPAEVVGMKLSELDRSGPVWWYRPATHKNAWRGQSMTKPIMGPAQEALASHLADVTGEYVFSPNSPSAVAWLASQRQARTTRVSPSEARRVRLKKAAAIPRQAATKYTADRYGKEIRAAVARANAAGVAIPTWSPNQLRHAAATTAERHLGRQAASRLLGHARLETTGIYAEITHQEQQQVAADMARLVPAFPGTLPAPDAPPAVRP